MAISLTAGMRNNLYSLQSTAKLMDQTQTRLATGKKVNSALDNSMSYFTAKNHMERANELDGYKDGMSEAVQAINAADAGIEGITSLINSAIAVAEKAKDAGTGSDVITQTISLDTVVAGNTITIGGTTFTASAGQDGTGGFLVGNSDAETAINLAQLINATAETDDLYDATGVQGSTISIKNDDDTTDMVDAHIVIVSDTFTEAFVEGSDEKSQLIAQYATLMGQLDDLVDDANYKGTNLLKADSTANNLNVYFGNDHSLELKGMLTTVAGLDLNSTANDDGTWADKASAQGDIDKLENALTNLTIKASDLSSNLSTITARQDFTDAMIQTLETGADKLTLADMNEEGANMLMLQTQQALGVNSLSLSAESAQSVLRLF